MYFSGDESSSTWWGGWVQTAKDKVNKISGCQVSKDKTIKHIL